MRLGLENSYAEELEGLYVAMQPQGFPDARLVAFNANLADELGLPDEARAQAAALFSGGQVPADAKPLAQAYAGHQFGGFSPQLGDGRALLLGEVIDRNGRRRDIQLKGSGRTAFSRGGDGKATLGPVLREYLIGEAMHHMGVPTTRVLAAMTTGESIARQRMEPGAVLARVAASHLRVGTLEYVAARRDTEKLRRLVNYTLARHYPDRRDAEVPAQALLEAVAAAQGQLIARWMLIGFIHGVMNTDNATLSGETIDYGPCAFMDAYDPRTVFSSIDHQGRYAYGNQPRIGAWNVERMAAALAPLLADDDVEPEAVQAALRRYGTTFNAAMLDGLRAKLGIADADEGDASLFEELLRWMQDTGRDYTLTFRRLADALRTGTSPHPDTVLEVWLARWRQRLGDAPLDAVAAGMDAVNPLYIPRNHLVEEALEAAIAGDLTPFERVLAVVSTPFVTQPGREAYTEPGPADAPPYQTFCGT